MCPKSVTPGEWHVNKKTTLEHTGIHDQQSDEYIDFISISCIQIQRIKNGILSEKYMTWSSPKDFS